MFVVCCLLYSKQLHEYSHTCTYTHHTHTHTHTTHTATVVSTSVSWSNLAMRFELTGGLIRNAVLSALSLAIRSCHGNSLVITEEHLIEGARLQLKYVVGRGEGGGGGEG